MKKTLQDEKNQFIACFYMRFGIQKMIKNQLIVTHKMKNNFRVFTATRYK